MRNAKLQSLMASAVLMATGLAAPALAQTRPASTTAQSPQPGLAIDVVRNWLIGLGAEVSETQRQGDQTFVQVTDGAISWLLFFNACQADVCGDVQFSAVFTNETVTEARVNEWNRDNRFLKAFYSLGADGRPLAAVQYDVLIMAGLGVDQLTDHTVLWIELLNGFGTHIGYFAPEAAD